MPLKSIAKIRNWQVLLILVALTLTGVYITTDLVKAPQELRTPAQNSNLLYESNFETGGIQCSDCNPDGWRLRNTYEPDGALVQTSPTAPVREGNYSLRMHLDVDDNYQSSPRAEIDTLLQPFFDTKTEYWVGWSIFLPQDYVFDSQQDEILTQFRHTGELCGSIGGSPPNAIIPRNGRWQWFTRWSADTCPTEYIVPTKIDIGPMERGVWTDFVARFYFSWQSDGILQVWRDGQLVVDRVGKPNFYNKPDDGPFMKIGIYKWDWDNAPSDATTRTVFYDAIRVYKGTDGYDLVAPGGGSPPEHNVADINQDSIVDILDYAVLVSQFLQQGLDLSADINNDEIVDILDYAVLVANFLRTGP